MDVQLNSSVAIQVVAHWFTQWNELERDIFLNDLASLEQITWYCRDSIAALHQDEQLEGFGSVDAYLSELLDSSMQLASNTPAATPNVFGCQLRLFHRWYQVWSLDQRQLLTESLKFIQLQSIHDQSTFHTQPSDKR